MYSSSSSTTLYRFHLFMSDTRAICTSCCLSKSWILLSPKSTGTRTPHWGSLSSAGRELLLLTGTLSQSVVSRAPSIEGEYTLNCSTITQFIASRIPKPISATGSGRGFFAILIRHRSLILKLNTTKITLT